jgi:uncharacterized Fe-S center protein
MRKNKRFIPVLLLCVLLLSAIGIAAISAATGNTAGDASAASVAEAPATQPSATASDTAIKLQIGNPVMTVNGRERAIDENGTVPVIQNNRTLLPVRAVVEAFGGLVEWDGVSRTATLTHGDNVIRLVIGNLTAYLNDVQQSLDVTPEIINGRTMLPIRFIAESFGFDVEWNGESREVTITGSNLGSSAGGSTGANGAATVYFTTDISSEGLMAVYEAMNWTPTGDVAVKISTGEPPDSNYLRTELIGDLVKSVDGTFVECNTAYGGSRAQTAMHLQVAKDHGYVDFAGVDIQDANGSMTLPVVGGEILTENYVGASFADYDFYLVLSHFKGHQMAGYGGAIKNISIGIASSEGKSWIHTAGTSRRGIGGDRDAFLKSMAEAGKSVSDALGNGERIAYVNVMNRLSIDCDCVGNPAEPDIHDIGILASVDPVALDQACIDLIWAAAGNETFVRRVEGRNGLLTLEHAEKVGLGSREYNLVTVSARS